VIYRLDIGGLENGLVNLINRFPKDRYRHAVVCLAGYTDFRKRIGRDDVQVVSVDKRPGKDFGVHVRLFRLFRELRPDVVHTRNLATIEAVVPAVCAGVPVRVHGEHGWDVHDLDGSKRKYHYLRRGLAPLIDRFIALSRGLERYLTERVGVDPNKIDRICNGVDTDRFRPRSSEESADSPFPWSGVGSTDPVVIGTVGRMEEVKDPLTLVAAFARLKALRPDVHARTRLVMVGNGSLRPRVEEELRNAGLAERAWLPGPRDDVPRVLRGLDLFVLPSLAEGISNTILEAMASGVPVVATNVGGNGELVENETTGVLVPPSDPDAMAHAFAAYVEHEDRRRTHGRAARKRALSEFSMNRMVEAYLSVYDSFHSAQGEVLCAG
jgi:sugar transferase (PEP-CTERM/EpsH1 system associated)